MHYAEEVGAARYGHTGAERRRNRPGSENPIISRRRIDETEILGVGFAIVFRTYQ